LIVSTYSRNSGGNIQNDSVYSLFLYHSGELQQDSGTNRNQFVAREGFYLKLLDGEGTLIDQIGTLTDKDAEQTWELPECLIDRVRTSMIRRFDKGVPRPGTELKSWIRAYNTKTKHTSIWYGRDTDIGTPGYRSDDEPLPVTLSAFSARVVDGKVITNWTTESEVDNAGFYIYRSETKDGEFKVVNTELIQGAGTTGERNEYTWTDTSAKPNTVYYYRIEDVSHAGVHQQLATVRLRGFVSAKGKFTTRWADLKTR
jgi:hypothetical protein